MEYQKMKFGKYKGETLDKIPMEYLIWLYGVLSHKKKDQPLKKKILSYFLEQEITVIYSSPSTGYKFYFTEYSYPNIDGTQRPFLISWWRGKDSNGNYVYEVGNKKFPIYFVEIDGKYEISKKYVSYNYKFGGLSLVYERNPNYYFYDGLGKIMTESYLLRKPYVPELSLSGDFSENLPMENLKMYSKYQKL